MIEKYVSDYKLAQFTKKWSQNGGNSIDFRKVIDQKCFEMFEDIAPFDYTEFLEAWIDRYLITSEI